MLQQELVRRLKHERIEQGMTYDDIAVATESLGTAVSSSSIRRVFADGSESREFRLETTLIPIAKVLLDEEEVKKVCEGHTKHSDLVEILSDQAVYLKKTIRRKNRIIMILSISLVIVVVGVIGILIYDKLNSNMGWFQAAAAIVRVMI